MVSGHSILLTAIFFFHFLRGVLGGDDPVSIFRKDDFNLLRDCAKCCFKYACWHGNDGSSNFLSGLLSCDSSRIDSCFCREDLQVTAVSHLSTCVQASCGKTVPDITSAVAVYTNYCKSTGIITSFTITEDSTTEPTPTLQPTTELSSAPEPTLEPTSESTPTPTGAYSFTVTTQKITVTTTQTPMPTPTATSTMPPSSSASSAKIASSAILIGMVTVICLTFSSSFCIWDLHGRKLMVALRGNGFPDLGPRQQQNFRVSKQLREYPLNADKQQPVDYTCQCDQLRDRNYHPPASIINQLNQSYQPHWSKVESTWL